VVALQRDACVAALAALREEERQRRATTTTTTAAHYVSHDALRQDRAKGVTPAVGPRDVSPAPLTLAQEIGWSAHEAPSGEPRHSKRQCEETKFAQKLHEAGFL
jgi:hypothetical protein